ncbi:MAG TPA: hypothetical protein VEQ58_10945 [Polyangiaceae bacterium]|nr:hypothetical protein [Polyangiaceae bacterium]
MVKDHGFVGARSLALTLSALGLFACEPTFDDRSSEVLDRRVLAVQVTPAQAKPGQDVTLSALVVEPSGTLRNFSLGWAFCNAAKPVAETNDVSAACLAFSGEQFEDLGRGATVTGALPKDACRRFGPDVPPNMAGEAPGRPTDPDSTGSFYQPVRVLAAGSQGPLLTLAQAGLSCGLPVLTGEQLLEYQKRVRINEHPQLLSVLVNGDESSPLTIDDGESEPLRVSKGQTLSLRATWPECPATPSCGDGICGADELATDCPDDCKAPRGCFGAETYIYFDPLARQLVDRREAMRLSWFAGAGTFDDDHTGRREDESATFSDGFWTAPSSAGPVHLWVVLRDSRGGTSWQSYVVEVE